MTRHRGPLVVGLSKADFELFDEGKRIDSWDLEVIDLEDFGRQTVAPNVTLPPAARRHFFFLFDLTFAQPVNIARARHAGTRAPLDLLFSFRPEKPGKGSYTLWVGVKDRVSGAGGETLGFFDVR
jgi:hypothetical protein